MLRADKNGIKKHRSTGYISIATVLNIYLVRFIAPRDGHELSGAVTRCKTIAMQFYVPLEICEVRDIRYLRELKGHAIEIEQGHQNYPAIYIATLAFVNSLRSRTPTLSRTLYSS